MSGRIPQHFIDELMARTDLAELIGTRVPLKRQGKEYKACCPFHGEKTPSFTVVPDKQFYHCFGCGAHGTALGFLMDHDHLSFIEAVEELAERAGLEVPREQVAHGKAPPEEALYQTLERASEHYSRALMNDERAKDYFKSRGITGDSAANFALGYAPDAWDAILTLLGTDEAARLRLQQVGLIIERERKPGASTPPGHYDRFRDRVMFPIRDARGRTIGFGGRVLGQGEPKYLNSPETELFHKGRELYGLYEARQATRSLSRLVIVEGYMDVVSLHQAGITYAVATLGTATTVEHLTRVFRICNEVVFCFDGDRAGRDAAWRALQNSLGQLREGRQIRFLFLPDGQDPDSLVSAEGREGFESRLAQASALSEYFIGHLASQVDTQSVDGRARLGELARGLLERIPPGLYRELLADEVAKVVGLKTERLQQVLGTPSGDAPRPTRPPQSPQVPAGRRNLIRQAIHLLVHHPQIAGDQRLSPAALTLQRPGIALLAQLLEELSLRPCATTGALLERWRERPDVGALARLATLECMLDASGAAQDLAGALGVLEEEATQARREQLLTKHGQQGLDEVEKAELQALLRPR